MIKKVLTRLCVFVTSFFICSCSNAQKIFDKVYDTAYYKTYPQSITVRVYSTKKYADMQFHSSGSADNLEYRGNTKLNAGVGITYKGLSINLSYGFGFLNRNGEKGDTKAFDFQVHPTPGKWATDLLIINYQHLYVYPKGYGTFIPNTYYLRPDAQLTVVGLDAYRVVNAAKFSYSAAFTQDEWQKKSAGTFLYGGGIYYSQIKSNDSSLIPSKVASSFSQGPINKFHFLTFGPGAGYAYTLVVMKHFFAMASLIANANIYFSTDALSNAINKKTSFEPAVTHKFGAGYNGDVWNVSATWAGTSFLVKEANVSKANFLPTGDIRFNIAKRINIKRKE